MVYDERHMKPSSTDRIVTALTQAIVEHRLQPGAKLVEQVLATHFGVSRTIVRQALFQLSQKRLVTMEPARGAFVATPSVEETRQVFAVRRMLELEMTRAFVHEATDADIALLHTHVAQEQAAVQRQDIAGRTELLGDFHVRMAELLGNRVLARVLGDLLARIAIATLMYQTSSAADHSAGEHAQLVECLASRNAERAVALMRQHLDHVEAGLNLHQLPPTLDIKKALTRIPRTPIDLKETTR